MSRTGLVWSASIELAMWTICMVGSGAIAVWDRTHDRDLVVGAIFGITASLLNTNWSKFLASLGAPTSTQAMTEQVQATKKP